jgi:hypothetical protein
VISIRGSAARVDELAYAGSAAGFEDPLRAEHIDLVLQLAARLAPGRDDGRQVDHDIDAMIATQSRQVRLAHIRMDVLHARQSSRRLGEADIRRHHGAQLAGLRRQCLDHLVADVAARPGDENRFVGTVSVHAPSAHDHSAAGTPEGS